MAGDFDIQVNGYAGADFCSRSLTIEQCRRACDELAADGVGGILATVITDSIEGICDKLTRLVAYRDRDPMIARMIAGFHVEGPFLSRKPGCPGAHDPAKIMPANVDDATRIVAAGGGLVRLVTLAPECDAGLATTSFLARQGITVSAGHCDPSLDELEAAIDAGLSMVTHLGNGCANTINRHDNPLWPQLANDALHASLICDGFHLRDDQIAVFHRVKGTERTILTADAVHLAMMPPGDYVNDLGDTIHLGADGCVRYPAQGVLAGAALPLSRGVAKIRQVTGCTLAEAIRMATANPARLYGITDRGELRPGMRADLIVFRPGPDDLAIERTYVAGTLVHDASARAG